jgi:ElaB/YqjD/DUF883 family membrane-anchored ribosome-binding protein
MAERDVQAELELLKSEMSKIRADFAGVAAALKGAGAAEAASLKESTGEFAASVKEQLRHALEEAKAKGKKSVEVVEHQVGEHPFITILAAFGIGFLVAKVLDRKNS